MDEIVASIIFVDGSSAPVRQLIKDNPLSNYVRSDEIPEHLQEAYNKFAVNRACFGLDDGMSGNYMQDIKQFISFQTRRISNK